ncbi:phage holin family protein [Lientehia hominis]|uniref:phage holin family protein n=1 Tax=Lientehia hominis TaxID=2897778 RepID=UPI002ED84739
MDFGTIGNVVGITVICYLAAMAVRATTLDNKWIPVICGLTGGILGAIGMRFMPNYPADDYISAIAVGIVSGLAATGSHQIYKQMSKKQDSRKGDDASEQITAEDGGSDAGK